jgi:glucose-1-phosphate thymidylyltransferase
MLPDVTRESNPMSSREMIGLIPAGGHGSRIAPLSCSKEVFPIGFQQMDEGGAQRPKVACHYLIESMRFAGVTKIFMVLRPGKWDIPRYLGDGSMLNVHLAYLITKLPFGPPYTLDQAYPFVRDSLIAFGFPDIIFEPQNAFEILAERQRTTGADLVLGLFPTERPEITDMVDIDDKGWVRSFLVKPPQTELRHTWITAIWTPLFTEFMHEYLRQRDVTGASGGVEATVGDVIRACLDEGLRALAVSFANCSYLDIGTPDDLAKAVRTYAAR